MGNGIKNFIIDNAWSIGWSLIRSIPWYYFAGALAVFLVALLFVSTIMGIMRKHTPVLMTSAFACMTIAWYMWPKSVEPVPIPPRPVPVVAKRQPIDWSWLEKLKNIQLPTIALPDYSWLLADHAEAEPDGPDPSEEARRRKAEAERKAAIRRFLRAKNQWQLAVIGEYIARGTDEAVMQAEMEQRQREAAFQQMMNPVIPRMSPPIILPDRPGGTQQVATHRR